MLKHVFVLFLAVGLSLQVPLEDEAEDIPSEMPKIPDESENHPVGECPYSDHGTTSFLRDESDCTSFYVCSNGVPYKMTCSYPLHFNADLQVCDFPDRAGCAIPFTYTMIGRCPKTLKPGITKRFRDSEDKTIYYECVDGQAVKKQCPEGTIFNIRTICAPDTEKY